MELEATCTDASDCKLFAREFVMNNFSSEKLGHIFRDASGQNPDGGNRAICVTHANNCILHGREADCLLTGLSCQPVSVTRRHRFSLGAVESHPEYRSYDAVLAILEARDIKCGAIEEVMGFAARSKANPTQPSPLEELVGCILALGKYDIKIITLDCFTFVKFQRKRLSQNYTYTSFDLKQPKLVQTQ